MMLMLKGLASSVLSLIAISAAAGDLMCADISTEPAKPAVDYATEVQPIFDSNCSFCHSSAGSLSLEPQSSYEELYCAATETTASPGGSHRVVPRDPNQSWLYLRVACMDPSQSGFRMPMGGTLPDEQLRLIFDWIAQGAYPSNEMVFDASFEALACP